MTAPFKGLHTVKKTLASGERVVYYYAWRGGPRILANHGSPEFAGEFAAAHRKRSAPAAGSFEEAICQYLSSSKFKSLKPRTQAEYRRQIDIIRRKFGSAKLSYFNDNRTRQLIYRWRDQYAKTPRKADFLISVLSAVLTFLVDQSWLERNIVQGMNKLYKSNRSSIIWTDAEIQSVCRNSSMPLSLAIRLAALTGLRTGDLIAIPWSAVRSNHIEWRTSKNDVDIVIPLTPDIQNLLNQIPRVTITVLTNTKGQPWTADGLKTVWGRAVTKSGVDGKHFHDLRGTAATKFCLAGLSDIQIASIVGWKPTRVAEIRARYVDRKFIVQEVIDRLEANKGRTETVNRGVNRTAEQNRDGT